MKEIINQVIHGKVHLHVGKAGLSKELLDQINKIFKNRQVIKVKLLNLMEFETPKEALFHLSKLTNSNLVDVRGKTGILVKNKPQ